MRTGYGLLRRRFIASRMASGSACDTDIPELNNQLDNRSDNQGEKLTGSGHPDA